jgi:hypothetical protein
MTEEIEPIIIGIGSGIVGGLVVLLLGHFLTKERDRSRDRETREEGAKSAVKERRRQLIGFLKAWRIEFSKKILEVGGFIRNGSAFAEGLPVFVSETEIMRDDFTGENRERFVAMAESIAGFRTQDVTYHTKYDELERAVDSLIAFLQAIE